MLIPTLSLIVAVNLRRKLRGRSNLEVQVAWDAAWNWIAKRVWRAHLDEPCPPLLHSAAYLYILSQYSTDPEQRQAHLYDAYELIAPFHSLIERIPTPWRVASSLLGIADAYQTPWRNRSEEHTSELQSLMRISDARF